MRYHQIQLFGLRLCFLLYNRTGKIFEHIKIAITYMNYNEHILASDLNSEIRELGANFIAYHQHCGGLENPNKSQVELREEGR